MRILSGICHEGIEDHIKGLAGISSFDAAGDKESFVYMAAAAEYDVLLLSKELPGEGGMERLLGKLKSKGCENRRIACIYGEYDDYCDSFIKYLIGLEIYDFHVGGAITSKDIRRLIFRPSGKARALGYVESRFDNDYYNYGMERGHKWETCFSSGATIINKGLKQLFGGSRSGNAGFERQVVSIISNQATGKSHTAWNLACCLSGRRYSAALLNIDRGYSANLFFDVDESYYELLNFKLRNNEHRSIADNCYRRKNLRVITGRLGDENEIDEADFIKLLYGIRTKTDITIIDTRTGLSELTRLSVKNSTCDLLVFDCDIMHYHMNMKMLEELKEDFVPEKTIAVINNTNIRAPVHKSIYNRLADTGIPFRDIACISGCGLLSSEMMHTGLAPYNSAREDNRGFVKDIDNLLDRLSGGQEKGGFSACISGR
ncbi:MAG TPA: hypothetical protein VN580_05395 [Clostridia bacterium]|nr:hypothetical protein [Clostridia bacterium]